MSSLMLVCQAIIQTLGPITRRQDKCCAGLSLGNNVPGFVIRLAPRSRQERDAGILRGLPNSS